MTSTGYDGPPLDPTPGALKMVLDVSAAALQKLKDKDEQGGGTDLVECIAIARTCRVALDEWLVVTAVDYIATERARKRGH